MKQASKRTNQDEVLRIQNLSKHFGSTKHLVKANDGISMAVQAGQVVGVLGHNGAGKTTLVKQVIGLLKPDRGTIHVGGHDAVAHPDLARRLVNVQAQGAVPVDGLSPRRAIELVGRIRGGQLRAVRRRAAELIDALDIGEWADKPAQKVSGGIARLTAFAMAAVMPGTLLILDEPTNDVDPVRRRLMWQEIRRVGDTGAAVLLVTHNVHEAERAVDSLVVLDHGTVIAEGSPASLIGDAGTLWLEFEGSAPPPSSVTLESTDGHRRRARIERGRESEAVAWASDALRTGGIGRFELRSTSLEEVYVSLVETGEVAA